MIFTMKKTLTLLTALAVTAAVAQTPYDEGQKALREQRWMAAAQHFEDAQASPDQADAAMYWRAHALYRAGHRGDAARQVRDLERAYPDSEWVTEARALQIEYDGSPRDATVEDELRIYALSQLMERDLDRALPLVIELLNESESPKARRDALFVLGMSDAPQARQAVADLARNGDDPALQRHAISMLGVAGNEQSLALLASLYADTDRRSVRKAVIGAYVAYGDPARLAELLSEETDTRLQKDIIHALGAMDATRELQQILDAESDPAVRGAAIEGIAISGGADAGDALADLYANASSEEKAAVVKAMLILDDAPRLIGLLETETDPGLRRKIVETLAVMDSEQADDYLFEMLEDRQ